MILILKGAFVTPSHEFECSFLFVYTFHNLIHLYTLLGSLHILDIFIYILCFIFTYFLTYFFVLLWSLLYMSLVAWKTAFHIIVNR